MLPCLLTDGGRKIVICHTFISAQWQIHQVTPHLARSCWQPPLIHRIPICSWQSQDRPAKSVRQQEKTYGICLAFLRAGESLTPSPVLHGNSEFATEWKPEMIRTLRLCDPRLERVSLGRAGVRSSHQCAQRAED